MTRRLVFLHEGALEPTLFRRLDRAIRSLRTERIRSTYQTNFWQPLGEPADNLVGEAIDQLLPHLPHRRGLVGAEWWLSRMRTSAVMVDFHQDRDERLALETGRLVHPTFSSVLFLNRCRGGLLAVTEELPSPDNPALAPSSQAFDLVAPRPNRYAVFRGDLTHGVLDSENQVPGVRRQKERHLRLAIAINFWTKRPRQVPTFADSPHYRSLSFPARARGLPSPSPVR